MKRILRLSGMIALIAMVNLAQAAVKTSAQSGTFSDPSSWAGGVAPSSGDDIVILTGHTITLDVAATLMNITINAGGVLDNDTYSITIDNASVGNPVYTNNGVHQGTGKLISYDDYWLTLLGNGITNCPIEIRSYGLVVSNTCDLTVNGNIAHAVPGNNGMNNKEFISVWQGGSLTVNGDLITDDQYMVGLVIGPDGLLSVSGNVTIEGGLSTGSGSNITNNGTFHIGGNLAMGPYSSYCDNYGIVTIGGNLTGAFDTYFIQETDASVSFGGSVFPDDDGFLFTVESPLTGSSIPNTVEYNGVIDQTIAVPTDAFYSNLIINNGGAVATILSSIDVNNDLTIRPEAALTIDISGSLSVSGTFTIESDASGSGSFISETAINGQLQRFVAGYTDATHGWHFLSTPVSGQLIADFHTPGSGDDFYKWDEATDTWINRTADGGGLNAQFETTFGVGTGYLVSYAGSVVKTFSGSLNASNIPVSNLSYTGSSTAAGWHLIGNPFSSALTWNDGNWNLSQIDANAQVWNEATASYTVISANGIIPVSNGLMVHASADNASLTLPKTSRTHSLTGWYKSTEVFEQMVLTVYDLAGATSQSSIVRLIPEASPAYDADYDSYFLAGFAPRLYTVSGGEKYALNTLSEISAGQSIPLGFEKNASDKYEIRLNENSTTKTVYLLDKQTSSTVNLSEGAYGFTAREGDLSDRFELFFDLTGVEEEGILSTVIRAWMHDGRLCLSRLTTPARVRVVNLYGSVLYQGEIPASSTPQLALDLPAGIYLVQTLSGSQYETTKVINK